MKKTFFLCSMLSALLIGTATAVAAVGDTFTENRVKYKVLTEDSSGLTGTCEVVQNMMQLTSQTFVDIPATIENKGCVYTVVSIGEGAFNASFLYAVVIPNTVTAIGNSAFAGCDNLLTVKIPGSVTNIGENAFLSCKSLNSVDIQSSDLTIGDNAFGGHGVETLTVVFHSATPPEMGISSPFYYTGMKNCFYVPSSAVSAYKEKLGWRHSSDVFPIESQSHSVTSFAEGYATAYLSFPADVPSNAKVYYGKEISDEGDELLMTEITGTVPAFTGLIVKKESGSMVTFNGSTNTTDTETAKNLLVGDYIDRTYNSTNYNIYKFTYADDSHTASTLGFYLGNADGSMNAKANKAYLRLPKNSKSNVRMRFDNEITSVDAITEGIDKKTSAYNLQGVSVDENYKGIVIINNKKVLRK